jgi:hypothetical protein
MIWKNPADHFAGFFVDGALEYIPYMVYDLVVCG